MCFHVCFNANSVNEKYLLALKKYWMHIECCDVLPAHIIFQLGWPVVWWFGAILNRLVFVCDSHALLSLADNSLAAPTALVAAVVASRATLPRRPMTPRSSTPCSPSSPPLTAAWTMPPSRPACWKVCAGKAQLSYDAKVDVSANISQMFRRS
jgi:hypothetical protein